MRQIYKDTIIGFIFASFVFSPVAFAKPRRSKAKVDKPLYTQLEKTIRSNKRGLKISKFVASAKPMVKKREFRDMKKGFLPFWDKKFDKMVVGKDHFVVGFKGQKAFGRYVDRGPIAFIINGKPLLWKDLLIYGKAKKRILEILGVKNSKNRRFSFQEFLWNQVFPQAHAVTRDSCEDTGGTFTAINGNVPASCACPGGQEFRLDVGCPSTGGVVPPVGAVSCDVTPGPGCDCGNGRTWNSEDQCNAGGTVVPPMSDEEEKRKRRTMLIIFGAVALLILFLLLKKKKKKDTEGPTDPEEPVTPGWTPEPEGQCPTVGARGLTEADLPPECRASTCSDTNACTDTDDGVIY